MSSHAETIQSQPGTAPGQVLVETKLLAPTRRQIVPRFELLERLSASQTVTLTLIVAPAGWGKTTLLADWHAKRIEARRSAWLALDRADDPDRFWTHLIGALRTIAPAIGTHALETLPVPGTSFVELGLPSLINEISALEAPVFLVIDDYHLIRHPEIHEGVTFLIEHMPPPFHLMLSTRSDPPLPVARLRASLDMIEIRANELRFTDEEATALLNGHLGLALEAEQVTQLRERTEGWVAGLSLAALSLKGRRDPHAFISTFAGDDRHVVDYLSSEVLAGQSEEARSFLMRTSILDPLCPSLCDAVAQIRDSARMLAEIERANSFLIPLDAKREWYRYHQLFGELLRHELTLTENDLVPELHRRASSWFRQAELIPEAIHHATGAGDFGDAAKLIATHWSDSFNRGMLETVRGWLDDLPPDAVTSDARLCLARAWLTMDRGEVEEAERWIDAAEAAIGAAEGAPAWLPSESDTGVLRAVHGFKIGDVPKAHDAARRVIELEPNTSFARTVALCIQGITDCWSGRTVDATVSLERAVRLARETANDLAASYALGYIALIRVWEGDPTGAERIALEATGLSDGPGFTEHFVTMMGHLSYGLALQSFGRLDDAERSITRSVTLARRGAATIETCASMLALADLLTTRRERDRAKTAREEARQLLTRCPDPGLLMEKLLTPGRHPIFAPGSTTTHDVAPVGAGLTDRELVVLRMLGSPLSRREIGECLFVSQNTVKSHTRAIYRKLDASTRREAVRRARELDLL